MLLFFFFTRLRRVKKMDADACISCHRVGGDNECEMEAIKDNGISGRMNFFLDVMARLSI